MTLRLGTLSAANQTVLDELSDSAKVMVPKDAYTQLTTEFVPAVKEVAKAGAELLKVYQALQKSSDQYVHALKTLVRSSKKAFPGAKAQGDGLNDLVTQYAGIVDQHKKCVSEFAALVSKTTLYGNEEKEKLREIFSKYQKEDKEIEKQRKKGTKTQSDVQTFVNDSAKLFLQQQELRYRFFYEKHRSWFLTYLKLIPQMDTLSLGRKSLQVDEAERLSAVNSISGTMTKPVHSRVDSVIYSSAVKQPTMESTALQENSTEINVAEIAKPQSTSVPEVTTEAVVEQRAMERTVVPAVVADRRQAPVDPAPVVHKESQILTRSPEQYMPNDWSNNVVGIREYGPPVVEIDPADFRPDEPEVKQYKEHRPPIGGRLVLPPLENNSPQYRVESEYNPRSSPAHNPVIQTPPKPVASIVPPLFNNSDYGRVLTVTQDFNATSGEQITVNRGNKVVLIKNGTRGWIFIKDADSQRTGWIPAPFVSY